MKILVVDHDPRTVKKLKRTLREEHVVDFTENGADAEDLVYTNYYDIVIIDMLLPDIEGEDLIRILKSHIKDLPIIAISNKHTVSDKNNAFENGADDYIVKPINPVELKGRIKANCRRRKNYNEKVYLRKLEVRGLCIDRSRRVITYKDDRISLRKKESFLLEYFMLNRGRVVTRGDILEHVWDSNINPLTNTVEVHVKRLRDKIEKPYNEKFIETIHGIGYLFE